LRPWRLCARYPRMVDLCGELVGRSVTPTVWFCFHAMLWQHDRLKAALRSVLYPLSLISNNPIERYTSDAHSGTGAVAPATMHCHVRPTVLSPRSPRWGMYRSHLKLGKRTYVCLCQDTCINLRGFRGFRGSNPIRLKVSRRTHACLYKSPCINLPALRALRSPNPTAPSASGAVAGAGCAPEGSRARPRPGRPPAPARRGRQTAAARAAGATANSP